ncbi:MAG: AraC family transcriptional regulator [Planctomycetota bacterium]
MSSPDANKWRRVLVADQLVPGQLPIRVVHAGIARWAAGASLISPTRAHFHLALVTSGDAWFEQDGRRHHVRTGEVFLQHVGSRQSHGTGPSGHLHKRWLDLDGAGLPVWLQSLDLVNRDVVRPTNLVELTQRMREVFRLLERRPSGYLRRIALAVCDILMLLDDGKRLPPELERLLSCIGTRLHEPLSASDLAAAAHCSPRQLLQLCRQHIGRSPLQLLAEERLARARDLLAHTEMSIKEIASDLGFADQFSFSHHFSRHCGCAPATWRERQRT